MDYQEWIPLFGMPANATQVLNALARHGITKPVSLNRDELSTGVDFEKDGMSLGFTSEFKLRGGVADLPILSSVVMETILGKSTPKGWVAYAGPLPHGLAKTQSKDSVLALFGEPVKLSDRFHSARWVVDGRNISILFTDDWSNIRQLGVTMPGAI